MLFVLLLTATSSMEMVVQNSHTSRVTALAFSPDGRYFVSSAAAQAKVWTREGTLLRTLAKGSSTAVMLPNGKEFALGDGNGLSVYGFDSGTKHYSLSTPACPAQRIGVVDEKTFAIMCNTPTIVLVQRDGAAPRTINASITGASNTDTLQAMSVSPDGHTIAVGHFDRGVLQLWNVDGTLSKAWSAHSSFVRTVAFSPDGQTIATSGGDGMLKLWRTTGELVWQTDEHGKAGKGDSVSIDAALVRARAVVSGANTNTAVSAEAVAFSPDGSQLLSVAFNGSILVLDSKTGKPLHSLMHKTQLASAAFDPKGELFLTAGGAELAWVAADNSIRFWRRDGQYLRASGDSMVALDTLAFSPNGRQLAVASRDKTVYLWGNEGRLQGSLRGFGDVINDIAYNADGSLIATADDLAMIKIWKADGTFVREWKHGTKKKGGVTACSSSPMDDWRAWAASKRTSRFGRLKERSSAKKT